MNVRSVRRPATERVIFERADPRLLRGVQQVALAGVALVQFFVFDKRVHYQ